MSDVLLVYYFDSTKIGEISDISKCFENFVYQALGLLARFYATDLRHYIKNTAIRGYVLVFYCYLCHAK